MAKKQLFDVAGREEEEERVLKINEEFKRRFEHNEKRTELHRLREKYPDMAAKLEARAVARAAVAADASEGSETSSSEEDDDDGIMSEKTDAQIFETLLKIRARDQSIYDKSTKFFSSSSDGEEDGTGNDGAARKQGARKEQPMYLKDVLYKQAMEGGAGSSSDDEGAAGGRDMGQALVKSYDQEQSDLKQAFLHAFQAEVEGGNGCSTEAAGEGEDAFGGVLQPRKRARASGEEGGERQDGGADDARVQQLLDGYFGRDDELGEADRFLKQYILNKGWVDKGGDGGSGGEEDAGFDDGEDEAYLEAAEQFEHSYNFRFEEPGSSQIVTYARQLEGTVRKEDDRRKRQRREKAERKAAEESARREEVKRLKTLKRQEIEERLGEIQRVAGGAAPQQALLDQLVSGDFDPEEYDRQMAAAFGDEYYEGDGGDEHETDLADEAFDRELEAMAGYGSSDNEAAPAGFAALQKRLQETQQAGVHKDGTEGGGPEGKEGEQGPQAAAARAEMQRLLEEYYKLDYEDHVAGIPTRFRYKPVEPDTFGLSMEEILTMEDKELNQIVGLKKLAPYREEHKRVRANYAVLNQLRKQQQQENRQQQQQWRKPGRGKPRTDGGGVSDSKGQQRWQHHKHDKPAHSMQHSPVKGGKQPVHEPTPPKSEADQRLESYAKPTLKLRQLWQRGTRQDQQGSKKHKRQQDGCTAAGEQQQQQDGPKLTKTQKKNLRRSRLRLAKRQSIDG